MSITKQGFYSGVQFLSQVFQRSFCCRCPSGRKSITYFVLFSYLHSVLLSNLALATNGIREELDLIELDFKGSSTPHRLHTVLPFSTIQDISHIEIDTKQQQVVVHKQGNQGDKTDDLQEVLSPSESVLLTLPFGSKATSPVIISRHDILNIPWELPSEKMTLFLINHTAWLTPLGEEGYRLEFRGGLLGGMMKKELNVTVKPDCTNPALGWTRTEICKKYNLHPPVAPNGAMLASLRDNSDDFMRTIIEQANYQSQMMLYNSQLIAHNQRVDKLLKEENEKFKKETSETIFPYLQSYYPSLQKVSYDSNISEVQYGDTYQIRPQSRFQQDMREAKDKRVLDPYIESWNKLYPNKAKKHYYELSSDPKTGYKSGMTAKEAKKVYEKWYQGRYEQTLSYEGSSLFKDAPSQYRVTPEYFAKSASQAGMSSARALEILLNPTLDNAYNRVLLSSRQNYLGGSDNLFVFRDIGISVGEGYENLLTHLKKNEYFSQLIDEKTNKGIKEGFERFCRERQEIFQDQLVQEWGVKDWRQVEKYEAEVPKFMRVGLWDSLGKKGLQKLVQTFPKQTQELLKRLNTYKEQLFARKGVDKSKTTLKAAEQELQGNQIDLAKQRGVTFDHVTKVKDAQRGLEKYIQDINNRLSYPKLPDLERKALQEQLAKVSKLLDHTEGFVPKVTK